MSREPVHTGERMSSPDLALTGDRYPDPRTPGSRVKHGMDVRTGFRVRHGMEQNARHGERLDLLKQTERTCVGQPGAWSLELGIITLFVNDEKG
ncbi:MAG: hypothetical protein H6Q39_719 [Chloroflexi bacterium]|nr:hypothetical protein [Chloroflexota bacterium]